MTVPRPGGESGSLAGAGGCGNQAGGQRVFPGIDGRGGDHRAGVDRLVTVLVVAGAGSTAICADLGARTIREEIDAMEVMGIDPIHRLVVPRVAASVLVATLLNGGVITIGLVGGFLFGVYMQHVSAGAYVSTLTLVTGLPEVVISVVKASVFGLVAGLVGCYRGLTVAGGPKGVGTAVNETLVLAVVALFAINVVLTTIGVRFGTGR